MPRLMTQQIAQSRPGFRRVRRKLATSNGLRAARNAWAVEPTPVLLKRRPAISNEGAGMNRAASSREDRHWLVHHARVKLEAGHYDAQPVLRAALDRLIDRVLCDLKQA